MVCIKNRKVRVVNAYEYFYMTNVVQKRVKRIFEAVEFAVWKPNISLKIMYSVSIERFIYI